jgi:peptidoglycan/LPS O-acetylase OafA/YrhL
MDKVRSIYLDLLRILSALYVFLFHIGSIGVDDSSSTTNGLHNHSAFKYLSAHYFVIIFFVLSGFFITMSANRPSLTFKNFLIARLGRLYSVLIPALIFSYLCTAFLKLGNFVPPNSINNDSNLFARFILNVTFLTQSWSFCATPPLNTPFWSVDYEFMYYLLIGTALLIKKNNLRYFLIFIVALISGLKVVILFPAWLGGSFLYFHSDKVKLNAKSWFVLFIISSLVILFIIVNPSIVPFTKNLSDDKLFGTNLFFSWNYQSDYVFSFIILINLFSLFGLSKSYSTMIPGGILNRAHNSVRFISNCTYTLYLFHLPMLYMLSLIFDFKTNSFDYIMTITIVFIIVYFIARQTEMKVEYWRSVVDKIFHLGNRKAKSLQKLLLKGM